MQGGAGTAAVSGRDTGCKLVGNYSSVILGTPGIM